MTLSFQSTVLSQVSQYLVFWGFFLEAPASGGVDYVMITSVYFCFKKFLGPNDTE